MTDKTYNGWTNYATWRVNLEIFDSINPWEDCELGYDAHDLANALEEYVTEIIESSAEGLGLDYALAFLSDVNFREIAENMLEGVAA